MNIPQIHDFMERFRQATIGKPVWVEAQKAYEYENKTVEVVVVLKLIQATHALSSMFVLTQSGLLIDLWSRRPVHL
jgi:hypothetical protein